jgi:hypothetical protein
MEGLGRILAGLRDSIGLPLKVVGSVATATVRNFQNAGKCIGWQKEYAPALVLAHVDSFVCSEQSQVSCVAGQDDMTECHGAKVPYEREFGKDLTKQAAMEFNDTLDKLHSSNEAENEQAEECAQQGIRRRPRVGEKAKGCTTDVHLRPNV